MTKKKKAASNPKAKRKGGRNPEAAAIEMYEKFHGKPPDGYTEYETKRHYHKNLAQCGKLIHLMIELPNGKATKFSAAKVVVATSEDGGQLYFYGGDQSVDLAKLGFGASLPKDFVVIGRVWEIAYHTTKHFHNFEPIDYYHFFGKGSTHDKPGPAETWPVLCYDIRSQLVFFAGGCYQTRPEGIVN